MADDKDPTVEDPHPGLLNGGWPCNAAPPAMSENGKTLTLISHGIPPSHPSIGDYPQQSFILRHESTSTQGEGVKNLSWKRSLRAQPRSSLFIFLPCTTPRSAIRQHSHSLVYEQSSRLSLACPLGFCPLRTPPRFSPVSEVEMLSTGTTQLRDTAIIDSLIFCDRACVTAIARAAVTGGF